MTIDRILLIIIIIYLIFSHKKKSIENFAVTDDIRLAVKEIYNTDMNAIRVLSDFAKNIYDGTNLYIPGDLTVNGKIKGNKTSTDGDISNSSHSLSGLNSRIDGVISSLNSAVESINKNIGTISSSITTINNTMPVSVRFVSRADDNNQNAHEFIFIMDSELLLTWQNADTWLVRDKFVQKAQRLNYPLAEKRVKVSPHSWDFRWFTSFALSIPAGKAVRIFSWSSNTDNDTVYGPGVHYVKDLRLPIVGGFHGIWAGLESKKYEIIPPGYTMENVKNM